MWGKRAQEKWQPKQLPRAFFSTQNYPIFWKLTKFSGMFKILRIQIMCQRVTSQQCLINSFRPGQTEIQLGCVVSEAMTVFEHNFCCCQVENFILALFKDSFDSSSETSVVNSPFSVLVTRCHEGCKSYFLVQFSANQLLTVMDSEAVEGKGVVRVTSRAHHLQSQIKSK